MFVKKHKKGFTLIEMLIVIAVIAILVAVIIPIVGNSTTKANAATNAANLRSIEGEIASMRLLQPGKFEDGTYTYFAENDILTKLGLAAPGAKKVDIHDGNATAKGTQMRVAISDEGDVTATYRGNTVAYYAEIAEHGTSSLTPSEHDQLLNRAENTKERLDEFVEKLDPKQKQAIEKVLDMLASEEYDTIPELTQAIEDIAMDASGTLTDEEASAVLDVVDLIACSCCRAGGWGFGTCSKCGHSKTLHVEI